MNVHVLIMAGVNKLAVYRGDVFIAKVEELEVHGEPAIFITAIDKEDDKYLTFGDLDIIHDNWDQMQEIRKENSIQSPAPEKFVVNDKPGDLTDSKKSAE